MNRIALVLLLAAAGCTTVPRAPAPGPEPAPSPVPSPAASVTPAPARVTGITLPDPWSTGPIVAALKALPGPVAARVVFDEGMAAKEYREVVKALDPHTLLVGELLDSQFLKACSADCFGKRAAEYFQALPEVDVWEVANEINGDQAAGKSNWVGADSWKKVVGALRLAKAAGKKTAVTFYLQPDLAMFGFIEREIAPADRALIDWALVSYYEKDNGDWLPPWQEVFDRLGALLPGAQLGIGECGDDRSRARAETAFDRYYRTLEVRHPRYIFGGFWWYQAQLIGKNAFLADRLKAAVTR